MIKKIIRNLNNNSKINAWLITEKVQETTEAFYVLQKLQTTRMTKTSEYTVTLYHDFYQDDERYRGSSSFTLSHDISKKELEALIEETLFSATFVKNKFYEIVKGEKKRVWKQKPAILADEPMIDQIAQTFFQPTTSNCRFNSLEVFIEKTTIHLVNSRNVNLQKTINNIIVEAIPSYDGTLQKVELYKLLKYESMNLEKIAKDAVDCLEEVKSRYEAVKVEGIGNINVILKNNEVKEFFNELIGDYSYYGVYTNGTDKRIGDTIQPDAHKDLLNITMTSSSKENAFDSDGVILKTTKMIEDGKIINYYGSNRFAYYLQMEPNGNLNKIEVAKGKTPVSKMKAERYLEIIALSGIQIDIYSGYIGGEIRLANYFDGEKIQAVSGLSFSGNINEVLKEIILSKETVNIEGYFGPQYIKLANMDVL